MMCSIRKLFTRILNKPSELAGPWVWTFNSDLAGKIIHQPNQHRIDVISLLTDSAWLLVDASAEPSVHKTLSVREV
jgi:hypothetical protein